MEPPQQTRRAIALSSMDLLGAQELLLYGCEDCACPVSDTRSPRSGGEFSPVTAPDTRRWVRGRDVVEMRLDPEHQLLFNPLGHGGVVVANEPAPRVSRGSQHPATDSDGKAAGPGEGKKIRDV